jgi:hypothetical protein
MRTLRRSAKKSPKLFTLYVILRVFVIGVMVAQILNGNYNNVFLCVLTLVLFMLPSVVERRAKIDVPDTLEAIILLFIFAAEILGEIGEYYINLPGWDTMLHTMNGFLSAAIGFALIDIINREDRFSITLTPFFVALVAFCFSMTIGVLWEFFEFAMDMFAGTDMQKDTIINGYRDIGLIDTMKDLLVNFIGATIFSIFGYLYIKHRGAGRNGRFIRRFILTRVVREDEAITDITGADAPNDKGEENDILHEAKGVHVRGPVHDTRRGRS